MRKVLPSPTLYLCGSFHRRLQPLDTEKQKVSCSGFLPKSNPMQHSCSYYNAFCSITSLTRISLRTWQHNMKTFMQALRCDLQAEIPKHPTTRHTHKRTNAPKAASTHRYNAGTKKYQNEQSAPAAHTRYFSSPAAAILHRKTEGFVLRLSPQIEPHAAFMQPLQCVLQHHAANPHLFTHMATQHENSHADFTLRSASRDSKTARELRTHTQMHKRTQSSFNQLLQCGNQTKLKMNGPHPPHTHEVPFIAGCSHFTRKNKVSCSGFLPNQTPCSMHAAITMRFAVSRR